LHRLLRGRQCWLWQRREQRNYGYYSGYDYNEDYRSHHTPGILGGAQFGCNHQMSAWLVGADGDFSFAAMKGDSKLCGYYQSTKLDWIATAAARISYEFDNSLIYLKGGGA
jgi:hypothetical protein